MNNKDNIDKIDEQIKSLSEGPKEEEDDIKEKTDTKKVDKIEDIESQENTEETKVIDKIETTKDIGKAEDIVKKIESEEDRDEEEKQEEPQESKEETPKETTPPKKEKKNTSKTIMIALFVGIIILLFLLITVVILRKPKKVETTQKELTSAEKKQIIEEYGEALQGIISIYYEKQELLLEYEDAVLLVKYDHDVVCEEHEVYEDGSIYLNKCSIDEEDVKYSYGKKQEKEELKEGAIKVYISKKNKKATLKEPSDLKEYDTYSFDIDGKYTDLNLLGEKSDYIFYMDEQYKSHMINFKTRVKALDSVDYQSVAPISFTDSYDQKYVAVEIDNKWGVYNLETEERTVPNIYSYFPKLTLGVSGPVAQVNALEEGIIATVIYDNNNYTAQYGAINYRNNKDMIPREYRVMRECGKYIFAIDFYEEGHIFDHYGKEYLANTYDELYWAVDGKYVLVKEKDDIKLVSVTGKEIYNYGKLELGKVLYGLSYKGGATFQFENPKSEKEDLDGQCIEVIYDPNTKKGETKKSYCGGIAKPILYLYPKKTTKVTVEFEHPELLETTYPKFVNRWEVTAKKNGDLIDKDGKYYYGLYWDEKQIHSVDFETGFYVTKENAISFLEEKLTYIGLNDKERNEFITYWLPILEKNVQSLVYFELTEERESYNKIYINPEPDSLLRLVIHIKKVDHKVNIKKESLNRFHRKGFVAVEWGGTTY